jgi:hypothetical protein
MHPFGLGVGSSFVEAHFVRDVLPCRDEPVPNGTSGCPSHAIASRMKVQSSLTMSPQISLRYSLWETSSGPQTKAARNPSICSKFIARQPERFRPGKQQSSCKGCSSSKRHPSVCKLQSSEDGFKLVEHLFDGIQITRAISEEQRLEVEHFPFRFSSSK